MSGCSTPEKPKHSAETDEPVGEISVIPQPNSIVQTDGYFKFDRDTNIVVTDEASVKAGAALNRLLLEKHGFTLEVVENNNLQNSIVFSETAIEQNDLRAKESYLLKIEPQSIKIQGSERGMYYGVQTLIQLIPLNFGFETKIPTAEISDAPRFRYRGMHLDAARHFMSIEFIKKIINQMSRYKYNYFHWHLTDDQGWRIEINKYPRLTGVGSKRRETVVGKSYQPYVGDNIPVEGYYTQQEIRDVVKYAEERYVTIIPEIEMPGHSSAALAAYPELGCRKNYPYKVQTTWGAFPEIFCPTDTTFKFIEDVLSEVIELFPNSPYIHIGGDEVMANDWKNSKFVQELKRTEKLSSEKDVQSWFLKRVENFVNSKGKKIIGWDEVSDGDMPANITIMSWRGMDGGIKAANAKHEVIMTPADFTYFDHPQGNSKFEPLSLGKPITLEKVYSFEPVPSNLKSENSRYVIGGQGCVWTEFLKKPQDIEYMMFPRAIALAEVLWSEQNDKDFADFSKRLYKEFPNLDQANINYRIPEPQGLDDKKLSSQEIAWVDLNTPIPNGRIYYTLNGTVPNERSNMYISPFIIDVPSNKSVSLKTRVINSEGRKSSIFTADYIRKSK